MKPENILGRTHAKLQDAFVAGHITIATSTERVCLTESR